MSLIIKIIFLFIVLSLFVIAIIGVFIKPIPKPISLSTQKGGSKTSCDRVPLNCTTDVDCLNCMKDGEKYTCQTIGSNKICSTTAPQNKCNSKFGGIPLWTGWGGLGVMEWECNCSESQFAGNSGCQKINPNICEGSENANNAFKWPASGQLSSADCTCNPSTHTKMVRNIGQTPMCVPKNLTKWYEDTAKIV